MKLHKDYRRQGLGEGGKACIQIKGFGKARRPNK